MLQNNLDPEVAEHPEELVVYGGTGKAARDWASFHAIVAHAARRCADDETLLVQSGKPVGVMQTHEWAPRVLIANSNLVGDWANWDEFRRLEALGLTMYGQMTAGSWIYIGTQGILQGTYETFAAVGEQALRRLAGGHDHADRRPRRDGRRAAARGDDGRRRGDLRRGRPVAHRSAGSTTGYLDVEADDIDHALELATSARHGAAVDRPARQLRRRLPRAAARAARRSTS